MQAPKSPAACSFFIVVRPGDNFIGIFSALILLLLIEVKL